MLYEDLLAPVDLYQPLRPYLHEFRLLTVFAGAYDDPVECVLRRSSLDRDHRPRYETISYCWGESEHHKWGDIRPRGSVLVNGSPLNVPASSESALRRMRLTHEDRVLWIDSICINQSDVRERGHQVSMIGSVYRMAAGNLIHLGDDELPIDSDGLEEVADQVRQIVYRKHSVRSTPQPQSVNGSIETESQSLFRKVRSGMSRLVKPNKHKQARLPTPSPEPPRPRNVRDQLQRLEELYHSEIQPNYEIIFSSEWFTRLWVVQEASLAIRNTCYWGEAKFSLDDALALGIAAYRYATPKTRIHQNAYSTRYIRRFIETNFESPITGSLQKRPKGVQLFRYVKLSQHLTCIDPHDRVYAVLDMYKLQYGLPHLPPFLEPNYTKPISDLYRDMTRLAFSGPGATELLDMVLHTSNRNLHQNGLPSWAIRWQNKAVSGYPPSERDHYAGQTYQDSRCFLEMEASTDPNILSLQGYIVGRIARRQVVFSHRRMVELPWVRDVINGIFTLLEEGLAAEVYADVDHNALLSTLLTRGRIAKDTAAPQSKLMSLAFDTNQDQMEAFVLFKSYLETNEVMPSVSRNSAAKAGISESVIKFLGAFNGESNDRCVFQLDTGHIGSGPPILQEGDTLAIFSGTENAHILRRARNGDYDLIGFAYVEGLMHGQVLNMGLKKQVIRLR